MFSSSNKRRISSAASTPPAAGTTSPSVPPISKAPLVSPLQMTFDFELEHGSAKSPLADSPFSPVSEPTSPALGRPPWTSQEYSPADSGENNDRNTAAKQLQAPYLPPIPRVASAAYSTTSEDSRRQEARARDESDNISTRSRRSVLQARLSFEHPIDLLPSLSRPGTPQSAVAAKRRQTIGQGPSSSGPIMESSLFPTKLDSSASPSTSAVPAMSRSFIDSRDKPYGQTPPKVLGLQPNHSSPDLVRTQTSPLSPRPPLSARSASKSWLSPRPSFQDLSGDTNYSGSTARASTRASTLTANSAEPASTIGTPYASTAASFPLPQLVTTRPKTSGPSSTLGGVAVLTHHTSTPKVVTKASEKRKTRLLNPLALLQRRRSNQDPENAAEERMQRQAQAQALARQRDVVASGISKPPEDFDPRIRGRVVHDFSAPRRKRNTFDEAETLHYMENGSNTSTFSGAAYPPRNSSLVTQDVLLDGTRRRSTHTPVFMEHLGERPEAGHRANSIQAENLENKDFLQRASKQSTMSTHSQESAVLPPFARRSQILDPIQASLYHDDDSKRSSDPSSSGGRDRESTPSSVGGVSPITAQSQPSLANIRSSMSPVSPGSPGKSQRQFSDGSPQEASLTKSSSTTLPAKSPSDLSGGLLQGTRYPNSSAEIAASAAIKNGSIRSPLVESFEQQAPNGLETAEVKSLPFGTALDRTRNMPTSERTPEPDTLETIHFKPIGDQPKLVEKRASAVGHSRKGSNAPKHQPSNASRFSFQYGSESAAQEQALEEKHRKMRTAEIADSYPRSRSPSEMDEDDYFDEDAMDDMDEMEMQQSQQKSQAAQQPTDGPSQSLIYLQQARQMLQQPESDDDESAFGDGHGEYGQDEHELRTPFHLSAYRGGSAFGNHTRQSSLQTTDGYWGTIDYYTHDHSRKQSQVSELNFAGSSPMGPLGMQKDYHSPMGNLDSVAEAPDSARNSAATLAFGAFSSPTGKPELPHRDSGNSERNRVASGLSFSSPTATPDTSEEPASSREPTVGREERVTSGASYSSRSDAVRSSQTNASVLSASTPATSSPPPVSGEGDRITSGLNLDSPTSSPRLERTSLASELGSSKSRSDVAENAEQSVSAVDQLPAVETQSEINAQGGHSSITTSTPPMTLPVLNNAGSQEVARSSDRPISNLGHARFGSSGLAGFDFDDGTGSAMIPSAPALGTIAVPTAKPNPKQSSLGSPGDGTDDMYFDDGNFDQDISDSHVVRIDENAFDDDSFLARPGMLHGINHRAQRSSAAFTTTSLGSDGPYPSFAMPNAPLVTQRYSQMMLEDLPLQAPVDPKYIPQRNPSEDMKRLGLSDRVPPVPVPESDSEAYNRMKANLERYHATLADAANKAALEGRFLRMPSNSTSRSLSASSKTGAVKPSLQLDNRSMDGESMYSEGEGGGEIVMPYSGTDSASNFARTGTTTSHISHLTTYSPPKMSFDFGFDQVVDSEGMDDLFMNDEDLVAAANAEALANDEDGFYGQEFDFYGRPRANSNELDTINGGYFGHDGDDGLARNKSLREPNLTPITERSEFSTRNSFIGLGVNTFGPASAGGYGPLSPTIARMPVTPLVEGEVNSFDELRKLRANAFGGDAGSLRSSSNRSSSHSLHMLSPTGSARPGQLPFAAGGAPMQPQHSNESHSSGSTPASAHPAFAPNLQDSPHSGTSNMSMPFSSAIDPDATPKKTTAAGPIAEPTTARKVPPVQTTTSHSRNGSGAESVTYIRTPDPEGSGRPRWVLERRRTSEQGQLEIIGRELVQGGWI